MQNLAQVIVIKAYTSIWYSSFLLHCHLECCIVMLRPSCHLQICQDGDIYTSAVNTAICRKSHKCHED